MRNVLPIEPDRLCEIARTNRTSELKDSRKQKMPKGVGLYAGQGQNAVLEEASVKMSYSCRECVQQ